MRCRVPAPCQTFLQQGAPGLAPAAQAASTGKPYLPSALWRPDEPEVSRKLPLKVRVCPNDDNKGRFWKELASCRAFPVLLWSAEENAGSQSATLCLAVCGQAVKLLLRGHCVQGSATPPGQQIRSMCKATTAQGTCRVLTLLRASAGMALRWRVCAQWHNKSC